MNPKNQEAEESPSASSTSSHQPGAKSGTTDFSPKQMDPVLPDDVLPLGLKTVAQMTDKSVKTVRRWIERGLLRSHKLGGARVVRKRDLRSFLDQQAGETNKERP